VRPPGEPRCSRCGAAFAPGALRYVVRIEAYADFDGVVAVEEAQATAEAIRELLAVAAERSAEALEADVYAQAVHLLCKACRDRFMANPLDLPFPTLPGA
jgi:hypothetical protein